MLSHDQTLVLQTLNKHGRADVETIRLDVEGRLSTTFAVTWNLLIDSGYIQQLNGARPLNFSNKLLPQKTYKLNQAKLNVSKLKEVQLKEAKLNEAVDPELAKALVTRTTSSHNFNANYQAVIDGKKGRRDVLQTFASTLSRQNQVDFWKQIMEMNDLEKNALRARVSRLAARSS